MKFTKMHGIGNDYVYVNCFEETVKDPAAVAKFVSDRHFGIGSDGLILIRPSEIADCEMDMYNLDGSQGAMCGNGIRCVAKYVYDHGIVDKTSLSIATRSGIKYVDLTIRDGKASIQRGGSTRTFSLSHAPQLATLQTSFGALLRDRPRNGVAAVFERALQVTQRYGEMFGHHGGTEAGVAVL